VALRASHRKYAAVDASGLIPIPDGVSDESAAWLGLAKIVQVGVRRARHEMGDIVVVIGMGLLGQLVAQYARLMGASKVIAVDPAEPRLRLAAAHGATHTFPVSVAGVKESILEATGGRLADVVYDVTGHPVVFNHALTIPRKFGKLILLGDAGDPGAQRLTPDVVTRGVQIIGAHDGHSAPQETDENRWTQGNMARLFFEYLEQGRMRVDDLITHRYAPEEAPSAYDMLARDRMNALGVQFVWA
jgi:threonine dehydrogenase-like Zn-dependent dehydrogenase